MKAILFLATAQLVSAFQDARDVLVVATPSLDDPRVIRAIGVAKRSGTNARVLLAPKADYLVEDGRLLVGSDPYASAQRELKSISSTGAEIFVDPRFSSVRAQSVRTGTGSGMSFAAMGNGNHSAKVALVCTGSMDKKTMDAESNVCVQTDDSAVHEALFNLHEADFDDTQAPFSREQKVDVARRRLVVSPGLSNELKKLVGEGDQLEVYTSQFQSSSRLGKLLMARGSKATLYVPPATSTKTADLIEAGNRGVVVRQTVQAFSGSMIITERQIFIGSQTLTDNDFRSTRHVGVLFERSSIEQEVRLGGRK